MTHTTTPNRPLTPADTYAVAIDACRQLAARDDLTPIEAKARDALAAYCRAVESREPARVVEARRRKLV